MVRFLYRADYHEVAEYLNAHQGVESLSISSALAGPWDQQALAVDLRRPVNSRWFDPRRALVFPAGGGHTILLTFPEMADELLPIFRHSVELVDNSRSFSLYRIAWQGLDQANNLLPDKPVAFSNGLRLLHVQATSGNVLTTWRVESTLVGLPPFRLVSNPPPPGEEVGSRLAVFFHQLDLEGSLMGSDDGFGVDPYSLQPGDILVQWHRLNLPLDAADIEIGLYDPVTGDRVSLIDGGDSLLLRTAE